MSSKSTRKTSLLVFIFHFSLCTLFTTSVFTQIQPVVISGIPATGACPGECFTITISYTGIPNSLGLFEFVGYADLPGAVSFNGTQAHDVNLLNTAPQEQHYATTPVNSQSVTTTVCITAGNTGPIQITVYVHLPSSPCSNDPLDPNCLQAVGTATINVVNVPLITPAGNLEVTSGAGGSIITEMCSGDPAYFSLTDLCVPPSSGNQPILGSITWEYSDDGGASWNTINDPNFNGKTCMTILSGHPLLELDCSTSTTGFVDRSFRAVHSVTAGNGSVCESTSSTQTFRICCPLTIANNPTTLSVSPSTAVCEGDVINPVVQINSVLPYIDSPAGEVTISWSSSVVGDDLSVYNQTTGFSSYSTTAVAPGVTITAILTNCAGKSLTLSQTIPVDLMPICGTIAELSGQSSVLTICQGDDATLVASGFSNCQVNWEISSDGVSWSPMGSVSNTQQNTNVLLPAAWPSSSMFYRVNCLPAAGSTCIPCQSAVFEVQPLPPPQVPVITGDQQICDGDNANLQVVNPVAGLSYEWFCNGVSLGTGPSITSSAGGCYWVEASNDCETVSSAQICVEVCVVTPIISCPQAPNACATLGQPITLSACNSQSSCTISSNLTFDWSWDNGNQSASSCSITDTPPKSGMLYTVTVKDANGCTASTSIFITPCD